MCISFYFTFLKLVVLKLIVDFIACEVIFNFSHDEYMGSLSTFLGIQHVLYGEVMDVILSIEYTQLKDFSKALVEM